jgi:hypothetical protein
MKMAEPRVKLAQKSKDIMETPARNLSVAITPNANKVSKREQDLPQKIKEHEEEGAAEVFWGGAKRAGTNHGRDTDQGSNKEEGQEIRWQHRLKEERANESDNSTQRKKTRSDD